MKIKPKKDDEDIENLEIIKRVDDTFIVEEEIYDDS
jgi:hypothetical protein|tara:strand:- start:2701 stop:2808 length:108 start_codon:yes stop_codon:yes gene_type:complete